MDAAMLLRVESQCQPRLRLTPFIKSICPGGNLVMMSCQSGSSKGDVGQMQKLADRCCHKIYVHGTTKDLAYDRGRTGAQLEYHKPGAPDDSKPESTTTQPPNLKGPEWASTK